MTTRPPATALCFGEVLWDCLPQGLFLGGAPVNVAYHLSRMGIRAFPVTAVGDDFLGEEILSRLESMELPTESVHTHPSRMTGAVRASISPEGNATYNTLEGVAWDEIPIRPAAEAAARDAVAVIYGSLSQRTAANRQSLHALLAKAHQAEKVFDVNLRPPFDDLRQVHTLAQRATLLKLNHEEAARLTEAKPDQFEANARTLADRTGTHAVCITAGPEGAGLLIGKKWFWEPGNDVEVRDTVGAGDSFLASLVNRLIVEKLNPQDALEHSCRVGEFITTREGATPAYEPEDIFN